MAGTVWLNFYGGINPATVGALISNLQAQIPTRPDKIVILLSSEGGRIVDGLTAYNFLRTLPCEVVTHNYGVVQSMAVVLFCAGRRRTATPYSRFLIHGLHWTFGQNESVPEAKLREYLESLEADRKNMGKIIADASGKEPNQIDLDVLAGRTLTADEARTYGLVHDVQNVQVPAGTEVLHIQG